MALNGRLKYLLFKYLSERAEKNWRKKEKSSQSGSHDNIEIQENVRFLFSFAIHLSRDFTKLFLSSFFTLTVSHTKYEGSCEEVLHAIWTLCYSIGRFSSLFPLCWIRFCWLHLGNHREKRVKHLTFHSLQTFPLFFLLDGCRVHGKAIFSTFSRRTIHVQNPCDLFFHFGESDGNFRF